MENNKFNFEYILDPFFWQKCWHHANNSSPIIFNRANHKKWQKYWNSISALYHDRARYDKSLVIRTLDLLENEGILDKTFNVLDIGCGTGTYTLPLAKRVNHINALDSAKDMLNKMMENSMRQGINNITPIHKSWYQCKYYKNFELVFTSFCPAIRDTASLMRMHRASNRFLCYVTAVEEVDIFKEIRRDLWQIITGKPFGHYKSFDVIYPFNFLYLKGFMPCLKFLSHNHFYEDSVENQIKQQESFFGLFNELDYEKTKLIIRKYLKRRFKDGVIKANITKKTAIMWWEV